MEYYSDIIIGSKHTCIELDCIYGLTLVGKYSTFVGNVRKSFIETNQGWRYSSKQFCTSLPEPCWKCEVVMNNEGILFKTWDTDWPLTPWQHYTYFESFVYSFGYVLSTNPLQRRNNKRSRRFDQNANKEQKIAWWKSEKGVQHMR